MTEAGYNIQDTIKPGIIVQVDTLRQIRDSVLTNVNPPPDTNHIPDIIQIRTVRPANVSDTVSVCKKNPVASITFYDTANLATRMDKNIADRFPYIFTASVKEFRKEEHLLLVDKLRPGKEIPNDEFHIDWILPLLILSAFIFGILRVIGRHSFRNILRFLTFQGINEMSARETGDLYLFPSTLFNFASFISISLFAYLLTVYYNISIPAFSGFGMWAMCLGIVIAAVTMRHVICLLTGSWSGRQDAFIEYLRSIYAAYRIAGLYCFIIVVLVLYTSIIPSRILFNAGIYGVAILYIMRASRLMLIFINRHISLFYYILYLCALEILPVVVLVKYVTGLV